MQIHPNYRLSFSSILSIYHSVRLLVSVMSVRYLLYFIPLIVIDISSLIAFKTFFLFVWFLKFHCNTSRCRFVFNHPVKGVAYSIILKIYIFFQPKETLSHHIFNFYPPLLKSSDIFSTVCYLIHFLTPMPHVNLITSISK